MARGGTPPRIPPIGSNASLASSAMDLSAAKAQDQFPESLSGGKSPIQNPDASYSARSDESGARAERERQAEMLERGESFVGAPAMPSEGPRAGEEPQAAPEETRARPEAAPETTTEESMEERLAREAQNYAAESARFSAFVKQRAEQHRAIMDDQTQRDQKSREEHNAKIWRGVTMLSGMTSFTGIGYILYFITSNVRLVIGSLFPHNGHVPRPTLPQIGTATVSNIQCCLCTPLGCFFISVAALLLLMAHALVDVLDSIGF